MPDFWSERRGGLGRRESKEGFASDDVKNGGRIAAFSPSEIQKKTRREWGGGVTRAKREREREENLFFFK